MTVKIGTVDFYRAMADVLNSDSVWAVKGAAISYTMVFVYDPPESASFFTEFDNGRVTEARVAAESDMQAADFVISGSGDVWRRIFEKSMNPAVAMMTGKLRVEGDKATLIKNMPAFQHVLFAMTKIDFE